MPISSIWICDAAGRVLGPLSPLTLRDLVASGRISEVNRVSTDGNRWMPLAQVPEISQVVANALVGQGERAQRLKASEIRSHLGALRGRRPDQVFGVPPNASLEDYRSGFFRVVKTFHPDKLPGNTVAELRDACAEMFSFLSSLMSQVEQEARKSSHAPTPPPLPPTRQPPKTKPDLKAPNYGPEEFVGIERNQNGVQATVHVNRRNLGIFTDHSLTNISSEGVFLPTHTRLPLGSLVNVRFFFENSTRQIRARARVVWENIGPASKGPPGYGVRFVRLEKGDQAFIQSFIAGGGGAPVEKPIYL